MGPEDDPETFLIVFEWVISANRWAPNQWATLLAPYLTGEAQAIYRNLPNDETHDNRAVRMAILDNLDITHKTFWCQFWGKTYPLLGT